jgi:hypothetical protein
MHYAVQYVVLEPKSGKFANLPSVPEVTDDQETNVSGTPEDAPGIRLRH